MSMYTMSGSLVRKWLSPTTMQSWPGVTTGRHRPRAIAGTSQGATYIHMSASTSSTKVLSNSRRRTLASAWIFRPGGSRSSPGNASRMGCRPRGISRAMRNSAGGSGSAGAGAFGGVIRRAGARREENVTPPGTHCPQEVIRRWASPPPMVRRRAARLDVGGVQIGHAEAGGGSTGVSVALFDGGAPAVVDVRGGASATYDLASLSLDATFGRRWAIFFSGGSLFGLDAAAGIRDQILQSGGGRSVFSNPHRIAPVSGAALFDLPGGKTPIPDYRALGREAARTARSDSVEIGKVGAGAGALVGKYRGRPAAMPGGLGWASRPLGRGGHL